ncbi:hypothetical protein [Henriciella litoralis]|uniref:hypothetical protein n=1 Tax=Henriciella litoralis TaxID=568102 RepID=UPI000A02AFE9|nr:hypothetical protein [Henriciella litoralis]
MWNFSLSGAFGLMARTAPYLLLRAAIYGGIAVATVLITGISGGVGWGIGGFSGPDGRPAGAMWGSLIGLGLTGGAIYLAREFILYQVKAAHIAVLIKLMDGEEIPTGKNQITYGASIVKERFVQSSVLFGIDQLVKGVLSAITGLIEGIASFLPIPGIRNVVGVIRAFLKIAVGFADEIILAFAIRTQSDNPWGSAKEALVYYGQNHKLMLKNAAWLAFFVYVLSFLIFLLLLAPAAALVWFLPGAWSAGGVIFAFIFAWAIKAALIEPLAITCMMQVYFKAIEGQTPDPEWQARLENLSGKFSKLQQKAASWAGKKPAPEAQTPQTV